MLQYRVRKCLYAGFLAAVFLLCQTGCDVERDVSLHTYENDAENALVCYDQIQDGHNEKMDDIGSLAEDGQKPDLVPSPFKVEQPDEEQWVSEQIQKMTLKEKICQLFFVSPEALTGYKQVTAAGEATRKALAEYPIGGVIYFTQNLQNESQTQQMLESMLTYAKEQQGIPLFLGVDEEGGRVTRIGGNPGFSVEKITTMRQIGQSGDTEEAYHAGEVIASYLSDLGFNLDFAPDADVLSNPDNTAIGDRSFGSDPEIVSEMAVAFSNGLSDHHIIPCMKHFPGHGGTAGDTHNGFAYTEKSKDALMECELIPFERAAEKQLPMIMASHISVPEITGDDTPTSLSYKMISGLLRDEIGYDGIVITDALEMRAITERYGIGEAAVLALQADCDMILMSAEFRAAYKAVCDAVEDGRITMEKIDGSVRRILQVKYRSFG